MTLDEQLEDVLCYDVHAIDQGRKTLWVARSFPGRVLIEFDAARYELVGMTFEGKEMYQLRPEYQKVKPHE